jgi:putative endonuclease
MFTTYVIQNLNQKRYIGQTENFKDRLRIHNDISPTKAKFHRATYKKGPWKILFKKDFETRREARTFEKYLKTGAGRNWLERVRRGE